MRNAALLNRDMRLVRSLAVRLSLATLIFGAAAPAFAQSAATKAPAAAPAASGSAAAAPVVTIGANEAELLKSAEAFVRKLFAWGADFQVKLGPLAQSSAPDFYRVPIVVTFNGQADAGEVFISKDGKTMFRGEMFDMGVDPFAGTRAKLKLEGDPAKGPADARVTIVEFSDYQCPHCRQLYTITRALEQEFPQVRVVHKDFPLAGIHPWATTAAVGARCGFAQSADGFWNMHDAIFENQDLISSENVYEKLVDFAVRLGLDKDAFKLCMASPEAKQAIVQDVEEGKAVQISSTPTVFVNGRPVIGGDQATLEQYIRYELGPAEAKKPVAGVAGAARATPGTAAPKSQK